MANYELPLDVRAIRRIIPHRYPILLVDRIVELEPGKRAVGLKNVTTNEWFFEGHFPDNPIMPGVLIIEALAQTGAVAALSADEFQGQAGLFAGIDRRFVSGVSGCPENQFVLWTVEMDRLRRGDRERSSAKATVKAETAAVQVA